MTLGYSQTIVVVVKKRTPHLKGKAMIKVQTVNDRFILLAPTGSKKVVFFVTEGCDLVEIEFWNHNTWRTQRTAFSRQTAREIYRELLDVGYEAW